MCNKYFTDLSNYPTISQDEQLALLIEAKAGDNKALNKLIECNLRLVVHHAKKLENFLPENSALTIEDLISEGNIALIEAVNKYEIGQGTHLSYFAGVNIKRYIIQLILNNASIIKLPHHKQRQLREIEKIIDNKKQVFGHDIDIEDVLTPAQYKLYNRNPKVNITGEKELELNLFDEEIDTEITDKLKMALEKLKPREKKIIKQYYGIDTDRTSIIDIAKNLGVTKARISQIHIKILSKLKMLLK